MLLGGVLVYAAYAKLRLPWPSFAGSISAYKLLPDNALEPVARTLPWVELALGILLISGVLARWSALIAALLLGTFFGAMVRSYAMGMQIDCGCFGPGEALGPKTLIRDGLLVALSIAVTIGAFRAGKSKKSSLHVAEETPVRNPEGKDTAVHPV